MAALALKRQESAGRVPTAMAQKVEDMRAELLQPALERRRGGMLKALSLHAAAAFRRSPEGCQNGRHLACRLRQKRVALGGWVRARHQQPERRRAVAVCIA